ncbi:hypothetical protein BC832DRAFT_589818 [Gaertneriomyces semiglobifer]|nr:hypothetical protein BC832DRAFT_589818 [Gaertneriomyces semiglobifer]
MSFTPFSNPLPDVSSSETAADPSMVLSEIAVNDHDAPNTNTKTNTTPRLLFVTMAHLHENDASAPLEMSGTMDATDSKSAQRASDTVPRPGQELLPSPALSDDIELVHAVLAEPSTLLRNKIIELKECRELIEEPIDSIARKKLDDIVQTLVQEVQEYRERVATLNQQNALLEQRLDSYQQKVQEEHRRGTEGFEKLISEYARVKAERDQYQRICEAVEKEIEVVNNEDRDVPRIFEWMMRAWNVVPVIAVLWLMMYVLSTGEEPNEVYVQRLRPEVCV